MTMIDTVKICKELLLKEIPLDVRKAQHALIKAQENYRQACARQELNTLKVGDVLKHPHPNIHAVKIKSIQYDPYSVKLDGTTGGYLIHATQIYKTTVGTNEGNKIYLLRLDDMCNNLDGA